MSEPRFKLWENLRGELTERLTMLKSEFDGDQRLLGQINECEYILTVIRDMEYELEQECKEAEDGDC